MATDPASGPAVLITGASTGIGEACAVRLARAGFRVFAGVRQEADGRRLAGASAGRLSPLMLDVTDQVSIRAAAGTVTGLVATAGLAGLVNNAGISMPGPVEFLPLEDLRRQLEVNVIGQVAVTQAFLPLIRTGRGRIVNIGSISGLVAGPLLGAYSASKFALEALTDSLRQELRPWGIHVAIVEPGSIATRIWEKGQAAGRELEGKLPPHAIRLYAPFVAAIRAAAQKHAAAGLPPDAVARVVEHALTSPRPRTRYLVGRDARARRVLARMLPDRLRDRLVARYLGLPERA
jgi:NAD(P)-dependent dehydrogenase (short-subunit alcohol dehydrogenase family)